MVKQLSFTLPLGELRSRLFASAISDTIKARHKAMARAIQLTSAALFAALACMAPASANDGASSSRRLIVAEGEVKVSRAGGGFVNGVVGQLLQPGDRVMVGSNSLAKISYQDNCIERVRTDRVIVVQAQPPCDLEGWDTVSVGEFGSISSLIGSSPWAIGIGAAAIGGIVAGIVSNGLRPSSP